MSAVDFLEARLAGEAAAENPPVGIGKHRALRRKEAEQGAEPILLVSSEGRQVPGRVAGRRRSRSSPATPGTAQGKRLGASRPVICRSLVTRD